MVQEWGAAEALSPSTLAGALVPCLLEEAFWVSARADLAGLTVLGAGRRFAQGTQGE